MFFWYTEVVVFIGVTTWLEIVSVRHKEKGAYE